MAARLLLSPATPAFRSTLASRQAFRSRSLVYCRRGDQYSKRSSPIAGVRFHTATTRPWLSTLTRRLCFEWLRRFRRPARVDQAAALVVRLCDLRDAAL